MGRLRFLMLGIGAMICVSALPAQAGIYCKTVSGEVEGFGNGYTRFTAERSRDRAIAAEKARRREMGRDVVKVDVHETQCKDVYPLGFEEWHCVAKADVCVER